MSKLYFLIGLAVGATAGSLVTMKIVQQKYRDIADAEIESVKSEFAKERKIFAEEKETEIKAKVATEKPDIMDYAKVLNKEGYTSYREKSTDSKDKHDPYIINPLKFGENEEYETVSLKYYNEEDILTDDNDELVEDPACIIPDDGIRDEFVDDVVYIRNDILKCDYEVILVLDSYDDVLADKPYLDSARLTDE